ncbi:DUF368 domain-containing protein [Aporhodopirellula aestuarii]|uniref:DUF368 domain-containing protein n=1 Tax=Aporhodopirellula aestuarii TaxID=2950107 RepID=A0ABT0UDU8_9BACT|nr:DUF368 domain-containing protein [Aporhodopirellula aestuarii]MCM2374957.1 DUF368 domain-containing protein [Aporhodopirellula aestuarii]
MIPQKDATRVPTGSVTGDAINVFRGFCMGAADTVPGVSGGTVALILGHYDRLIAAISHVDREAIGLVRDGRWRSFADKLDLRFTLALAIGIVVGIGSLAGLMHHLLLHRMNETMAVFFGLVLASVWVVRRNVSRWSIGPVVGAVVGIAVALAISRIPASHGEISLVYLFVSASIAICAMILPGISGAFVLLLLGVYEPVIGMIKQFFKLNIDFAMIMRLSVFTFGCAFGLLAFSRLLNYLLRHHHNLTMATLIGLMIGSIARLWPLQAVTPETADLELKFQEHVFISPAQYDGSLVMLAALALVAAIVVLVADRVTRHATVEG